MNTVRCSDTRFNDNVSVEEINEAVDNLSVEELRARFPYFYVRTEVAENEVITVPNPLPITVRNTWDPILLNSEESNYHLAAFKYEGNRLAVEMSHPLSDGAGFLPYLKSTLFLYLSRKTGQVLDPSGLNGCMFRSIDHLLLIRPCLYDCILSCR